MALRAYLDRLFARVAGRPPDVTRTIAPSRIRIEASSFCQLRCPSCPTTTGHIHPAIGSGALKFEDFRTLLASAPGVQRVELSNYGEIFLNPQLLRILEYAYQEGVAVFVENGANLNHVKEEVLEGLVKYRVRKLTCSIDGASPESYRKYRVRGDFDTVIRNIETINSYKRSHRTDFPQLTWQFVVFGHNEREIPMAREMANKLGMIFTPKLSWDGEISPIGDRDLVRAEIGWQSVNREEYEREHGQKYASSICRQLWDDPQINWDGRVIGCCRNFWGDFGGNAFTDGLINSVNNEKMIYAREMLSGRQPARDDIPCTSCEMYVAMRDRGDFIREDKPPTSQGGGANENENQSLTSRRSAADRAADEIDVLLAEVDREIDRPRPAGASGLPGRLTQLLMAPSFAAIPDLRPPFDAPLFSVVMAARNRAAWIGQAAASIQAQTFADWELIIVDDGSADNTPEVAARLCADSRIRYFAQPFLGQSAARNLGLRHAKGEIIAYLDSDNLWYPNFLQAAAVAFALDRRITCAYGALMSVLHNGGTPSAPQILFCEFDRGALLQENFIDLNVFIHRRALIDMYGVFDENLTRLVDWDIVLRYTSKAPAFRLPVLAAQYRVVDDQRVSVTIPLEQNHRAIARKWSSAARR
jgi:MoaA/NifB/PqqE/SkfB family radical SAM enzyme